MSKGLIESSTLTNIADAIRAKLESTETMTPGEMAALIESIEKGVPVLSGSFTLSSASRTVSLGTNFPTDGTYVLTIWNTYTLSGTMRVFVVVLTNGEKVSGGNVYWFSSNWYGQGDNTFDPVTGVATGSYRSSNNITFKFNGTNNWTYVKVV